MKNGIREPLYVTALKYAGIKVTPEMKPGHIWSLQTGGVNEALRQLEPLGHTRSAREYDNPSILTIENLSFLLRWRHARPCRTSISIFAKGKWSPLSGKNGAGKSTLSKLMCGFEKEDKGRILFKGQDIAGKIDQGTGRVHRRGDAEPQPDDLQEP